MESLETSEIKPSPPQMRVAEWAGLKSSEARGLTRTSKIIVRTIFVASLASMVCVGSANKGGGMSQVVLYTVLALIVEYVRHQIVCIDSLGSVATTYIGPTPNPEVFEQPVLMQTSYWGFPMHLDMGILRVEDGQLHFEGEQTAFSMPIPKRRLRTRLGGCVLRYPGGVVTTRFRYLGFTNSFQMKILKLSIAMAGTLELREWFAPPAVADWTLLTPKQICWRAVLVLALLALADALFSGVGVLILLPLIGFAVGCEVAHRRCCKHFVRLLKEDPERLFQQRWFSSRKR